MALDIGSSFRVDAGDRRAAPSARPALLILVHTAAGAHHPIRIMRVSTPSPVGRSPARVEDVRRVTKMSALRRPHGREVNELG
jgi:hypothetical protein